MENYLSRLTFYDLMGYLLPGLLGLAAAAVALSAANPEWSALPPRDAGEWFLLIVTAYFSGHVVQSIAARVIRKGRLRRQVTRTCSPSTMRLVRMVLDRHGITVQGDEEALDALAALKVPFADSEVFIARQGFFRGSCAAFAVIAFSSLSAVILDRPVLIWGVPFERELLAVVGIGCGCASWLLYFRLLDFIRHEAEYGAAEAARQLADPKGSPRKTNNV